VIHLRRGQPIQALAHAYNWALLWHQMSERSRRHLGSLDPRTDRLAILRWHSRWIRSHAKHLEAMARFQVLHSLPAPHLLN
jgi:hypothetical protein